MSNSPESVARAFIRAINRQDVDGLTALMSPDHRFVDALSNLTEGREKMGAAWTGYFVMVPDYSVAVDETYSEGPVVVLLGMARGTYLHPSDEDLSPGTPKSAPKGELKPENRWETPIAIRAFIEDGLVSEWRIYADNEPMRQIMKAPG